MVAALIRDFILVCKKIHFIRFWNAENEGDKEAVKWLHKGAPPLIKRSVWYTWYQLLVPHFKMNEHKVLYNTNPPHITNTNDIMFFINGVLISENQCQRSVHALGQAVNCDVRGLYNPTNSVWFDVFEASLGRSFNLREPITKHFSKEIKNQLYNYERVFLVGHSQGAVIISNILRDLKKDKSIQPFLYKLHIVTFGSGNDEMPSHPNIVQFANYYDYIAQIGILNFPDSSGEIIVADRYGHSFLMRYLTGLVNGKYGINTEIYKLVRK